MRLTPSPHSWNTVLALSFAFDSPQLPLDPALVKGFLDPREGAALYAAARSCAGRGPCVEIGGYCGKSAIYLGTACRDGGGVLFSIDHHRGSEENQPGWEYFDASLWDEAAGALDTLPSFRRTIRQAGLAEAVIPIVGRSATVARYWTTPLAFLFIDGGHSREAAFADFNGWAPRLLPGALLAIHDVFPDPKDGGRPPFEVYEHALASGQYEEVSATLSLRVLRRV